MSKWPVKVLRMEIEKLDVLGYWGDADVRIGELLIYGFRVEHNEEGQAVVQGAPYKDISSGSYESAFVYLDDELEKQVNEALIKAYTKEFAKKEVEACQNGR